jgi:charged multivesicular body protein 7
MLTQVPQEAANAIIAKASQLDQSTTSLIFSRSLFESEFAHVLDPTSHPEAALSTTDFDILLRYLSRDKPCLSLNSSTIKLKSTSDSTPQPITQQDTDIANLRTLIKALETQVSALTDRITTLDISAREAVAAKRVIQAKSALRSKKLAETTLNTRSTTLSQLEETYLAIQTAADQVAIVSAMSASANVLKSLHAEVGGTEGVEEVVDRLRDEMENVDEVGRVINEASTSKVDEEDVDEEFAAMERVEKEKKEKEEADRTAARLAELEGLDKEKKTLEQSKSEGESQREMQAETV